MAFVTDGTLMKWEEIKPYIPHIKRQARRQFVHQYKKYKDPKNFPFYWGDEIEYSLIRFDHEKRVVQLLLNSMSLLECPEVKGSESRHKTQNFWGRGGVWQSIRSTPVHNWYLIFTLYFLSHCFRHVIRKSIKQLLGPDQSLVTLTVFPRLGCRNFTFPSYDADKHVTEIHQSVFIADAALCFSHPIYRDRIKNMMYRRKERTAVNVPLYKDKNTMMPYGEDLSEYGDNKEMKKNLKPGHIYMDSFTFGGGCCSLQVTFQAADIKEAAYLYDNLVPLTPIMLALTAAAPVYRGLLSDTDCRWCAISQSCDDRTRQELGLEPLTNGNILMKKSRFDTVSSYLSVSDQFYNDYDFSYDREQYELLKAEGVDEMMSKYVAQLLVRDPIVLFKEKINQDIMNDMDHIQAVIGSNWQSLKLKLPDEKSGWKIEFRTMELQLTDFENAALVVFMVLLTRAIVTFKLSLLVPITKVDENFTSAQKRDSINTQKFHFREVQKEFTSCEVTHKIYSLMTLNEIMNGKDDFPGLIPLIYKYLDHVDYDSSKRPKIMQYLKYLSDKAAGKMIHLFSSILNKCYYKHSTLKFSIENSATQSKILKITIFEFRGL
ncbi:glutamate--cysteine ligase catalytic subunit-like [Octopus bimaculoides]|uniref:glutamate--cysteine ligase catalytic subunit-like n=1 Tax=Octopus bimaculoides TaxID=37653 RepID=UPI0022E0EF6D|nr:glutamate--cysteine ligase catalytic subunit-like [Octopus bimaculoides]